MAGNAGIFFPREEDMIDRHVVVQKDTEDAIDRTYKQRGSIK